MGEADDSRCRPPPEGDARTGPGELWAALPDAALLLELVRDGEGHAVDARVLDVNPAFEEVVSRPSRQVRGETISALYPGLGLDVENLLTRYARSVEEEEVVRYETHRPEGARWFASTAFPAGGDRLFLVLRDVTEERRSSMRLDRIHECLAALGGSYQENVDRITRTTGEILGAFRARYCLQEAGPLRGGREWRPGAGGGAPPPACGPGWLCREALSESPEGVSVLRDLARSRFADSDPTVRRDGLQTFMGAPVHRHDRAVGILYLVFREAREAALVDLEILETMAAALAREEERRRLEERVRMSQRLDTIGQLTGGVAHDFNNLVGGILGCADLLLLDLDSGESRENARLIKQAATRASGLTHQLLSFARGGNVSAEPLDVHELIREAVALLRPGIDRRVRLELRLEARHPVVRGDPSLLESALLNLGLNARDALDGQGTLTLSTRTVELDAPAGERLEPPVAAGRYLRVSVIDDGAGMTPEVRRRIFEPFFRAGSAGGGSGLGLTGVLGAVESHRGGVEVETEVGRGTRFSFYLPTYPGEATEPPRPTAAATTFPGRRVLVADDEDLMRYAMVRLLGRLEVEVTESVDGEQAVKRFRADPGAYDLVLLDWMMPRLGGREAFREIRRVDPQVPVVMMSGYGLSEEIRAVLDEGVDGFLQKPIHLEPLIRTLRIALERARGMAEGAHEEP